MKSFVIFQNMTSKDSLQGVEVSIERAIVMATQLANTYWTNTGKESVYEIIEVSPDKSVKTEGVVSPQKQKSAGKLIGTKSSSNGEDSLRVAWEKQNQTKRNHNESR